MCVPNYFWAEGVATAIYLVNIATTKAVRNQTPLEAWATRKPTVNHLKVFGCVAYALVPTQFRRKLDDKSEKCIFIGYSTQSKGYRLYNPITQQFIIRRDVKFFESERWHWKKGEPLSFELNLIDPFPIIEHDCPSPNQDHQSPPSTPSSQQFSPQSPTPNNISSQTPIANSSNQSHSLTPPHFTYSESSNTQSQTSKSQSIPSSQQDNTYSPSHPPGTKGLQDIYDQAREVNVDAEFYKCQFALNVTDPLLYEEAVVKQEWVDAVLEELDSIQRNKTWELVKMPPGKHLVG
ncbi:uncharacterized protein LOC143611561 [Bidens hawaiensis]|uniref:uncharacterized protein LOC143611561 n=1 Tax=Bidens hawaiensis TaxID=980011 RepID=UPI00404AAFE4